MINRRQFLLSSASLGLGGAALVTGSSPAAAALPAIPAGFRPYGPNGTHWPANTPSSGFGTVIDVACTWRAIAAAIAELTTAQVAGRVHIRVAAGSLPGSSGTVLANVGSHEWPRNILVSPAAGWGTVALTGTTTFSNVRGVTFARFNAEHVRLVNCTRTNWVFSKVSLGLRMYATLGTVTECNAYEVVMPTSKSDPTDPFSYSASTGATLTDSVWEGCYGAAVFRPAESDAHLDTFQMFGAGSYRGLTIRDSAFFSGANCGLAIGGASPQDPRYGTSFLTLDHSIVVGQRLSMQARYPRPEGAKDELTNQAINGAGEPWQLSAINTTLVLGSLYTTKWKQVSSSYTSHAKAVTDNTAQSGRWVYDARFESLTPADMDVLTVTPTDAYLASIWA